METLQAQLPFLAGGGDTGELIRSFNWSETSLGSPEYWPASLRTCVRIILTSQQPMFVWWGKDLINIHNDAYRAILGGKHPWAMGKPAKDIWKEIWSDILPRTEMALKNNMGTYDESLLLIMERNGYQEETYYTFSYSPIPGEDGEPNGIICANTDNTFQIISERQLRTLKDLGKAYIDSKSDNDIYNGTIKVLTENPQDFPFAMIYGTDADEQGMHLLGMTTGIPGSVAKQEVRFSTEQDVPWQLENVVKNNVTAIIRDLPPDMPAGAWPIAPSQAFVIPVTNHGQKTAYGAIVVGINPYRLLDEKYKDFFNLVTDQITTGISSVRAYEEERRRVEALIEIDKAKTVFFNNVSHEFRTPITLMLGPLEEVLQADNAAITEKVKDNLSVTYRNAQRLLKLVNSLLEFSRIEAGRVQASYKPVDIVALTKDLASGFRSIIEKAGLAFDVDCGKITKAVYVDREMWEKIVLNLLSNAFKYTLRGMIRLNLKQVNDHVELSVIDTGVGIPAKELPRMFERFHRVPNTIGRTHEGTGIGLSLINELVKMHHGEITVNSKVNEGSIFKVSIPTGKMHLPPTQVSDQEELYSSTSLLADAFVDEAASLLGTERNHSEDILETVLPYESDGAEADRDTKIMVVDDNADMRAYLQRLLEPYYGVVTASNGKVALEKISKAKPSLVVSDVMMPVMDGKELVREIRVNPAIASTPVILLSARAGQEARIDGIEAGADDYMVKPFSGKELLSKVRSMIAISRARNHAAELLRQLFMNTPIAMAILRGQDMVVELANEIMLQLWGKRLEDVLDKPLIEGLPELKGQPYMGLLNDVYITGNRYISEESFARLIRNNNLEDVYVKFIYEPLRETNGEITGIIVMAHEITDLVLARSAAQRNAEELENLVKRKDEFMSIASHELKTPITTMKASLQILQKMRLDPRAESFIDKATRQVSRLSVLVSDLLDVSSLQADKMKFYNEYFNMDDLLNEAVEQMGQSQTTHRITLQGDKGLSVYADRARLEQVINNLLSNAIKYSPGSDRVIVEVKNEQDDVKVSVTDYGIGIPDDKVDNVFDRFYRVDESVQNFSGLGLGLYISSEIMHRHNGQIGVYRNTDAPGSTFWFSLPKAKLA
jgi:signal transduction histidine kinase/CheY-like chemotaxis protein